MKLCPAALLLASVVLCASAMAEVETQPAAKEQTLAGTLGSKPLTAPESVVAVLYSGDRTINVSAPADIATKLVDLGKKGAKVELTGTVSGDAIAVSKIVESEAEKEEGNEKKAMKKEKKKEKKKGAKKDEAKANEMEKNDEMAVKN